MTSWVRSTNTPFLAAAAALLLVVGCAGANRSIRPPRVSIADLRVAEIKPLETVFEVSMRVINPNDTALNVKGIEYDLDLNGRNFGYGVSGQAVDIPPFGTGLVSVFVYSSVVDMARGLLTLPERRAMSYRIKGSVRVAPEGASAVSIPFEDKGTVDALPPKP